MRNKGRGLFNAVISDASLVRGSMPREDLITSICNDLLNWRIHYNCSIDNLQKQEQEASSDTIYKDSA